MNTISLDQIRLDPAAFVARIEAGEPLVVTRGNQPVAEVKPIPLPPIGLRPYGLAAGKFTVPPDFNEPLPEDILRDFEGR